MVNRVREILAKLVSSVTEYERLRDEEWFFLDENARVEWNAGTESPHGELMSKIVAKREEVESLLKEAKGV